MVLVPGVSVATPNVSVGASSTSVAVAGVSTTLASGVIVSGAASSSARTFAYGGGGGYHAPAVIGQNTITGFAVDGGYETRSSEEDVSSVEEYCIDRIREERVVRPVQAMCVDDRNTPHPASRLDAETSVDGRFSGEIYRCLAGSHMQVTLGQMSEGRASFAQGETFSCAKGEALWHAPGGKLTCRAQTPERNCNERSLLRRHGPGVKLVEVATARSYCEPAQRTRVSRVSKEVKTPRVIPAGDLVLDGGVGQGVW